ncbi:hypothetical protein RRG08_058678 [Elysia crispata]|uniref:Uncharacterized protein n=1 Tax=Elysia crispata TaxID=231223 RepID=A0AAE0YW89_9GAST|nr:hypothetical protein RRG08_058678 [Elysia crispata]
MGAPRNLPPHDLDFFLLHIVIDVTSCRYNISAPNRQQLNCDFRCPLHVLNHTDWLISGDKYKLHRFSTNRASSIGGPSTFLSAGDMSSLGLTLTLH